MPLADFIVFLVSIFLKKLLSSWPVKNYIMADDQRQNKESDLVQEFKLEQDNELRFEVESKEKATLEV